MKAPGMSIIRDTTDPLFEVCPETYWVPGFGIGGPDGAVTSLAFAGSTLYLGGYFGVAGNARAEGLALWRASGWSAPPVLLPSQFYAIQALAVRGEEIFVAGRSQSIESFTTAIMRWDGVQWFPAFRARGHPLLESQCFTGARC
jgi:hypothetical protein